MRISQKLSIGVAAATAATIAITAIVSLSFATDMAKKNAHSALSAIAQDRALDLRKLMIAIETNLILESESAFVADALTQFVGAIDAIEGEALTRVKAAYEGRDTGEIGSGAADDIALYTAAHTRFHPEFRRRLKAYGHYDIFLFDLRGEAVYTTFKEPDFATNFLSGPYSKTNLGHIVRIALDGTRHPQTYFSDFEPYQPSDGAPASFMVRPVVGKDGKLLGVMAVQLSVPKILDTFSNVTGLGKTGETLLINANSQLVIDSVRTPDDDALNVSVQSELVDDALRGQPSVGMLDGYRGILSMASAVPFSYLGTNWAIVAVIDQNEANEPVLAMQRAVGVAALGLLTIAIAVALWFAGTLTRPIARVVHAIKQLAAGDTTVQLPPQCTSSKDEFTEVSAALEVLRGSMVTKERIDEQSRQIGELIEWLHSANSLQELYEVVAGSLANLMPKYCGALFIYSNSRDVLEGVIKWGAVDINPEISADDCWGLRRGKVYCYGCNGIEFQCNHASQMHASYVCVPLLAHGETIGLLHLAHTARDEASALGEQDARLAAVCGEQISISIANAKLREMLRDQSTRDVLTGLFNRRYLIDTAARELSAAQRAGKPLSIIVLDVDHFKRFNDSHGHEAGDLVLKAVADVMTSSFNGADVACRFGGEEFVVLLPHSTIDEAMAKAEALRLNIMETVVSYLDSRLPSITISAGVSSSPRHGSTLQELIVAADAALYKAKSSGRNRAVAASPDAKGAQLTDAP